MPLGIIFISLLFMVVGMIVQFRLKSKFSTYSKVPTSSGLSGKEIAALASIALLVQYIFIYQGRSRN